MLVGKDGKVLKRNAFTVAEPNASPEVTVMDATVHVGAPVRGRWRNAPGALRDWIGIYAAGETDVMRYLGFAYTEAMFEGEVEIKADGSRPLPAGEYELRLLHDETFVALATARFRIVP